jgi:KaiC/GvpD/RAD55 family RecA-like ATPase
MMAQVNGSGKSTRAAHLLWLSWRAGLRPVLWVTEPELQDEATSYAARGGIRPLYNRAREAGALVIDEVGSMRGAWADTEGALGIMLALVSHRLSTNRRTIFTTHRPLTARAAAKAKKVGHSLQEVAPALYDRLREGLIIPLPAVSYRGKWVEDQKGSSGTSTQT